MRRLLASLVFLTLALVAVPAAARNHYPMKAPEYKKMIGARVEAVWERIDKKLDFHNVTADRKKEIRKTFEAAAKDIYAEVDKAAADGTVTRDEALRIGTMTSSLRGKVRGKLASEKKAAEKPVPSGKASADKPAAKKPAPPAEKPGVKKPAEPPSSRKPAQSKSDAARPPARKTEKKVDFEGDD